MLKIHKSHSKKLLLIPITSICITFGLLGLYTLIYTPELSHAETVILPEPKPDLSTITYMQDVNQEICANTHEADASGSYQYQLIDKRDGKTYWVAKLKDNNCWMTQNLDLDIPAEGLKAIDTDILEDWNSATNSTYSPVKTQTGSPAGFDYTTNPSQGYFTIASYDPGEYLYTKPSLRLEYNCGALDSNECKNAGWIPIGGLSSNKNGNSRAHYLAGNYYTFNAAAAGKGAKASINQDVKNSSICPKNWKLPSGGYDNKSNGSFSYLLDKYGIFSSASIELNDIRLAPFYFLYGGIISNEDFGYAGDQGVYWSSMGSTDSFAFGFFFYDVIHPSNAMYRYNGFSVRCMVEGGAEFENVKVAVNQTISLDVADEVNVEKSETNPSTANLDVKVSSNQKYSVGISAANPNLTSATSDVKIPAKSGSLNTAENGWGIKLKDNTEFTALTSVLQTFYTASGAEIKTIPFTIGISTALDLPNGEYSTDITVTATQN